MSTPKTYDPGTKHKLIPTHMRGQVKAGERPLYALNAPDFDRVPLLTFLVETMMGTDGLVPERAMRIVKPNDPSGYPPAKLTPDKRLLYVFWAGARLVNGRIEPPRATRMLRDAKRGSFRHVVMPGEDGYELLDAFKIACDIRKAGADHRMSPELLYRALGIDRDLQAKYLVEAFT